MLWFLGSLVLLLGCLLAVMLVGRAFVGALGIRRLSARSAEPFAAATLVGTALCVLVFGWLSYSGMSARRILFALVVLSALLIAGVALRRGLQFFVPHLRDAGWLLLAGVCALAALLSLLPLALGNAFVAINDTFLYVMISEYLQGHGWGTPVPPDLYQPGLGVVGDHQTVGMAVGPVFLLALVEAGLPAVRAIELYPAISAWGVVLNVLGVFLLVRWGAQLPRSYALLGGLLLAVAPNPVHTGAATGFFRQPFGTAALLFSLAVLSRAVMIRKLDFGYALVLAIAYAFLLAVYSELFPVLMLVTALVAVQALWRAYRLKITTYVLRAAVVVAACFMVLANVQIAKFVALFPIVTGIIVGWDVQWGLLDFWAFGMGTRQAGVEAAVPVTAPMPVLLTLVATVLLVAGLARLLTHRFATAILGAVAVFGAMAGYYGLVAHNPWTGALGHTWSLYKVAQWAFPVVLAVQVVGIWWLTRHWRPAVTGGLVVLAVLIALPTQAALARGRAGVMQEITRSARPFEAYRQLAEAINRAAPDTVFLMSPPGQVWPRALYTYFLYPRRIMGDWRNVPYLDNSQVPREDSWLSAPREGRTAYLAVYPADQGASQTLPGAAALLTEPAVLGIDNPNGLEKLPQGTLAWIGKGTTRLSVGSPRAGQAVLTFAAMPGPSLPERQERRVRVSGPAGYEQEVVVSTYPTVALGIPVVEGLNQITLESLDAPTVGIQPNGDDRPLLLGASSFALRLLDGGGQPAGGAGSCAVVVAAGWHALEQSGADWWRWTASRGQLRVFVAQETTAVLGGQVFSVAQPNEIDVLANGDPVAARTADQEGFQPFEPVLVPLHAGENTIELVSQKEPSTLPNDNRPLAIAVKDLSLTPTGAAPCSMQP